MKWVFEIIVTLVFAVLGAISAFQTVTLQESAMEPTYSVGQKFFVNRALYKIKSPKRGNVIVFKTSASDDAALHIRRVIGLPGETVQIKEGQIYINGNVYEETGAPPARAARGLARIALDGNGVFLIFRDSHSVFPEKGRGAPRPFLLFFWKRSMSAVICPVKAAISLFERPLKRRMSASSASPAASSLP